MTNNWAKPELQPEIIALLSNRGQSFAALAKQAGYTSVYLFKKDYKDHIKDDAMVNTGARKRKTAPVPDASAVTSPIEPVPPPKPDTGFIRGVVLNLNAVLIAFVGLASGVVGLAINYQYNSTTGQAGTDAHLMGTLGILADVIGMFLPPAIVLMRAKRQIFLPLCSALIWFGCFTFSFNSGLNFAATNIADTQQSRDNVDKQRKDLNEALEAVKAERALIAENRSPHVIEQLITLERGNVPQRNLTASNDCINGTFGASAGVCAGMVKLRTAQSEAERRIELDSKAERLMDKRAALPSISGKDPGGDLMKRLTWGLVDQSRTQLCRAFILASLASLGGVMLAIARGMWV